MHRMVAFLAWGSYLVLETRTVSPPEHVGIPNVISRLGQILPVDPTGEVSARIFRWYLASNILMKLRHSGKPKASGQTYFILLEAKPGYQVSKPVKYAGSIHGRTQIPNIKARKGCLGV
jgi:hypothetical protein